MSSEQHRPPAQADSSPRCYRHPGRETWVRCTRCERPICPDCLRAAAVGFQCPDCVNQGRATTRQPTTRFGGRVSERSGVVTSLLIGANVVIYLVTAFTSPTGFGRPTSSRLFLDTMLLPNLVVLNDEYYRLITSAFLHVSLLHLLVNMVALGVVGFDLERVFGTWRYLALYLISALGGSAAVFLFDNRLNGVAGASGAIFGLFGATVVVLRRMGMDSRAIMFVIGINLVITFTIPGISRLGHLGGLAVGVVAAGILVYTPSGSRRTALQLGGLGLLLAVLVALFVYRTGVLDQSV